MNGQAARLGPRFHVLGSQAAYTKWELDGQEKALADGVLPSDPEYGIEPRESWGKIGVPGSFRDVPTRRGDYPRFYAQLAHALQAGGAPPVDPSNAVEVLKIIEQARR